MTTVVYHSADFDGLFCRNIAKKFLGTEDVTYIGWTFGNPPLSFDQFNDRDVFVFDLPLDEIVGAKFPGDVAKTLDDQHRYYGAKSLVWIDHHKTNIESHPQDIPGRRIDGVGACRLAYQFFMQEGLAERGSVSEFPSKEMFVKRMVDEPFAVCLAGEYDVWDHRGDGDLEFQYGLRVMEHDDPRWDRLLENGLYDKVVALDLVQQIIGWGGVCMKYMKNVDAAILTGRGFLVEFEGMTFLCLNHARFNSQTFTAADKPETGHHALMGFCFDGRVWTFSMYHAQHNREIDLSLIAKKYGGGGHKGACGFTLGNPPVFAEDADGLLHFKP